MSSTNILLFLPVFPVFRNKRTYVPVAKVKVVKTIPVAKVVKTIIKVVLKVNLSQKKLKVKKDENLSRKNLKNLLPVLGRVNLPVKNLIMKNTACLRQAGLKLNSRNGVLFLVSIRKLRNKIRKKKCENIIFRLGKKNAKKIGKNSGKR